MKSFIVGMALAGLFVSGSAQASCTYVNKTNYRFSGTHGSTSNISIGSNSTSSHASGSFIWENRGTGPSVSGSCPKGGRAIVKEIRPGVLQVIIK